jgi:ParB family transcriptional regulator, chromosome partitioning protein
MQIAIDLIEPGDRLRAVTVEQVMALAASMQEVGLLSPITVYQRDVVRAGIAVPGYGLVAGLHRLEAARGLGWDEISAHVVTLPDLQRQLAECDENLCGTKLSPSERALFTRRRKEIYEALHPETRQHVAGGHAKNGGATDKLSFADDTAKATGVDARTVRRDAHRGERIPEDVLAGIKGTDLDKGTTLDALARASDPRAEADRLRAKPVPPPPPVRNDAEAEDAWLGAILRLWNKAPREWRERFLAEVGA